MQFDLNLPPAEKPDLSDGDGVVVIEFRLRSTPASDLDKVARNFVCDLSARTSSIYEATDAKVIRVAWEPET